jgi:hypothetical protein
MSVFFIVIGSGVGGCSAKAQKGAQKEGQKRKRKGKRKRKRERKRNKIVTHFWDCHSFLDFWLLYNKAEG